MIFEQIDKMNSNKSPSLDCTHSGVFKELKYEIVNLLKILDALLFKLRVVIWRKWDKCGINFKKTSRRDAGNARQVWNPCWIKKKNSHNRHLREMYWAMSIRLFQSKKSCTANPLSFWVCSGKCGQGQESFQQGTWPSNNTNKWMEESSIG